jgi:cellulose synthase (UDP-forming)
LKTRSAFWSEFYDAFLAPTMCLTVLRSIVHPFGVGFRVTNKALRAERMAVNWQIARSFIVLLILHVLGIAFALAMHRHIEQRDVFFIVLYFAVSNMSILWMCLLVSMDVGHRSRYRRFTRELEFTLAWENGQASGRTAELSDEDVLISRTLLPSGLPARGELSIPDLGFAGVPVQVLANPREDRWQFVLSELSLPQYRALITELYCQPRQWDTPPKSELRAAYEYFRAGLRMYPLAEAE